MYRDSKNARFAVYAVENFDRMLVMNTTEFSADESSSCRPVYINPHKDHEFFLFKKVLRLYSAYYDVKKLIALLQETIHLISPDYIDTIVIYITEQKRIKISGNKKNYFLPV